MIPKSFKLLGVLGAVLGLVGAGSARADVLISGIGAWSERAPSTEISAAGKSLAFSFDIPDVVTSNPSSQAYNFVYYLNGVQVGLNLVAVDFYAAVDLGLFDLKFSDGTVLSAYGPDIGSSGTISTGNFSANFDLNGANKPAGLGAGMVTVVSTDTTVPEPATIGLFGMAVLALGAQRRRG